MAHIFQDVRNWSVSERSKFSAHGRETKTFRISQNLGWVLAKTRPSNRFSERVKSFHWEQFMTGEDPSPPTPREETGRKINPSKTATKMRSLGIENLEN